MEYILKEDLFLEYDPSDRLLYLLTLADGGAPLPSWLQFSQQIRRILATPQKSHLVDECAPSDYSEVYIDHINDQNYTVPMLRQICTYRLRLEIYDRCDSVFYYFTLSVTNMGPYLNK